MCNLRIFLVLLALLVALPTAQAMNGTVTGNLSGTVNQSTGAAVLNFTGTLNASGISWEEDFTGDMMAQFLLFTVVMFFGFVMLAEWKRQVEYYVMAGLFAVALFFYIWTQQPYPVFYNRIIYILLSLISIFFTFIKPMYLLRRYR